jgi:Fe-S-cluster containining protein
MLGMELERKRLNAATTATYELTATELRKSCGAASCSALCRHLNRVVEDEFAVSTAAGVPIACAPGCDYCCHLRVDVFRHEAVALLDHLRTRASPAAAAAIERRILANAQRIDGMTAEEHRTAGIPCAFLIDGRCSAYEVRPSACAAYHSLSRDRCAHSFHHPRAIGTAGNARPALLELQVFGTALIEATQAGCKAAGGASEQTELHQTLRALLARDQAA